MKIFQMGNRECNQIDLNEIIRPNSYYSIYFVLVVGFGGS